MSTYVRVAGLIAVLLFAEAGASAATPKEIEAAKKKGTDWLRAKYAKGVAAHADDRGSGPLCLGGLAMLEAGVPGDDPAIKAVTEAVRKAAWGQTRTYPMSLSLMYLDRYGEPSDIPLIQVLAVRLLVGQRAKGGWGYECGMTPFTPAEEATFKALKAPPVGKLHPEVEKYAQTLVANRAKAGLPPEDDNSNTQFATIALWMARKHGVPVNDALDLIERRFRLTQSVQTGGWGYTPDGGAGTPSMYCAGLIGYAMGIARREERRTQPAPKPEPEPKKTDPGTDPKKNPDDPFFNPKTPEPKVEPKKGIGPRPADPLDRGTQAAFIGLGVILADSARAGKGALVLTDATGHGRNDMYFLWSLERVCMLYGIEKIGGVNWYEAGAHTLVYSQGPDGSWNGKDYGDEVNTAFAVLFLCKSNLVRDLSGKVQKETSTEMKAGIPTGGETKKGGDTNPITKKDPNDPPVFIPPPVGNDVATLTAELLKAGDSEWAKVLAKLRDSKGVVHTQALTNAVYKLDGEKRKEVRAALAERLTRMNADTLRGMAKAEDPELRRGAVLAMAMKDEKAHIPDLVAALTDEEDFVVRAARAGLRSLTGEDFGPEKNASAGEKVLAAKSWREWLEKQKK